MCKYSIDARVCGIVGSVPTNKTSYKHVPRREGGWRHPARVRVSVACPWRVRAALDGARAAIVQQSGRQDDMDNDIHYTVYTINRWGLIQEVGDGDIGNTTRIEQLENKSNECVVYSNDYLVNDSDLKLEIDQINNRNNTCAAANHKGMMSSRFASSFSDASTLVTCQFKCWYFHEILKLRSNLDVFDQILISLNYEFEETSVRIIVI